MYKCRIQGCWLQKKMGLRGQVCYKVYAIHMASQHGVLEQMLKNDPRPYMQVQLIAYNFSLGTKLIKIFFVAGNLAGNPPRGWR